MLDQKLKGTPPQAHRLQHGPSKIRSQKEAVKKLGVDLYEFAEFIAMGQDDADSSLKKWKSEWPRRSRATAACHLHVGHHGQPQGCDDLARQRHLAAKMLADTLMTAAINKETSPTPLSHIAAQILDVVSPMLVSRRSRCPPRCAQRIAAADARSRAPDDFLWSATRLGKIMAKIKAAGAATKGLKSRLRHGPRASGWFSLAKQGFSHQDPRTSRRQRPPAGTRVPIASCSTRSRTSLTARPVS